VELPPILPSHLIVYKTPSSITPNVFVTISKITPYVDIVVNPKHDVIVDLKPIQLKKMT
jgi:hypothetical protein